MKFKGIELREGNDSEAELLVNVESTKTFNDTYEAEEYMEELEDSILYAIEDLDINLYLEEVDDNLIQVRSNDITFDQQGVDKIVSIYKALQTSELEDVNITIGVHVDGEEWFKRVDGSEYNEDVVSLDEFLANIKY